ncbi:SDR family oxidoreductase [Nocardia sp. NPDC046763]|uniref:SDR family oxidoreductase n=1 Tax=Nocardia sp. NPDC046763 TaxID=3155256 RepID=UPI0033DE847B
MNHISPFGDPLLRPKWPYSDAVIKPEIQGLRFAGKYADVAALSAGDPTALRPHIDDETRRRVAAMSSSRRKTALVFGANGFVGAHLIGRLSRDPAIETVSAVVRPTAEQTAGQRLQATVDRYAIEVDAAKLRIVEGTPTERHFGLSDVEYFELARDIGHLFNCASSTSYTDSYLDLRNDWFISLLRMLEFSVTSTRKHLTYVGSIGAHLYQKPDDFRHPDSWWYSGYAQMKWVNATLLGWLARSDTYSVTLCEAPYVLGSTDHGVDPGRVYTFWRIIELAIAVGAIWDGPGMNYVPVDVLCEVMTTNAFAASPQARLLPSNPEGYGHDLYAELLGLDLVSWDDFVERVTSQISPKFAKTMLSENIDTLMRLVHKPEAIFPPGFDTSWCDNRRLFEFYFEKAQLRTLTPLSIG